MKYNRILLKLSGESLMGEKKHGIDDVRLSEYASQIAEIANDEFAIEDESIENLERQNMFKELINKLLCKLTALDKRIIQKKFGINLPFPMSISEIAESEGISANKIKYSISNSMKIIAANIPAEDKKTIMELLG